MATYKISRGITFSIVRETVPANLRPWWEGSVFADGRKGRKNFGRCDELRIAQLAGFKYVGDVAEMVWGDFTSLEYRRIRS